MTAARLPTLAITSGDPAGVGPEVVLKSLAKKLDAKVRVLGDIEWLKYLATKLSLSYQFESVSATTDLPPHQPGHVFVQSVSLIDKPILGQLNPGNSYYVLSLLDQAHHQVTHGLADAIVTAPVHKGVINQAGIPFSGHTEYFAKAAEANQVVMMLASEPMRVALATTHLPLNKVSSAITTDSLISILETTIVNLQRLGIETPTISVLGLNPHAGEGGILGDEEEQVIIPAIKQCAHLAANIVGPLPADTAFNKQALATTDLFLAMYHDQGLPVIKFASFGACANVTLGLPYLRTSVDHGTALDIAARFTADSGSMDYALNYAAQHALKSNLNINNGKP